MASRIISSAICKWLGRERVITKTVIRDGIKYTVEKMDADVATKLALENFENQMGKRGEKL